MRKFLMGAALLAVVACGDKGAKAAQDSMDAAAKMADSMRADSLRKDSVAKALSDSALKADSARKADSVTKAGLKKGGGGE